MAVIGEEATSLVNLCSGKEGGDKAEVLINMMEEKHNLFKDMRWIPCNNGSTHKASIVTVLPEAHMHRLYKGFKVTKGITEDTCTVRTSHTITYKGVELNGKSSDWQTLRFDEGAEDLANQITTGLFYGDRDENPESINGLSKRMGKCNGKDKLKSSYNVLSAMDISTTEKANAVKALNDLTSIYIVGHGDRGFCGLVPRDDSAVVHNNIVGLDGEHLVDDDGKSYPAIEVQLNMDYGCCLHDFHFAARLANISVAALEQGTTTFTGLWERLAQICERIRMYRHAATWSFYANPRWCRQ